MDPLACGYIVTSKNQETSTITTLTLTKMDGTVPEYRCGQYLTVYFPDLNETVGKQYSISSAPTELICALTINAVGTFSHRLCSLVPGDTLLCSEPQGVFYPTKMTRDIVLIAGGIGVTSFRSIILEMISQYTSIRLMHSNKKYSDIPFRDEFLQLAQQYHSFTVAYFITQESDKDTENLYHRRIQQKDVLKSYSPTSEYLVSGSVSFALAIKEMLIESGVHPRYIATESYF